MLYPHMRLAHEDTRKVFSQRRKRKLFIKCSLGTFRQLTVVKYLLQERSTPGTLSAFQYPTQVDYRIYSTGILLSKLPPLFARG